MPGDRWFEWLDAVSLLDVAAAGFGVCLLLGGIFVWLRKLRPWLTKMRIFLSDWFGEQARDGVPGRKGVMQTLSDHGKELTKQSEQLNDHSRRLARIEDKTTEAVYNGKANSGHSPYDELREEMREGFAALNQAILNHQPEGD